ncbi:type II toxin-antitoxin system RelE/ParE family toxin [Fulvivirga sp. RKSG066]|uniref:type II toxin-antitoxin system RelE/ParE family toxin n=1 Tax=Fulvivirga aurantia TaxID=2529383 RepID=UPI0012BCCCF5|nr:type II toxin-antitoxin system RelE/ParE family toxin [Fulvivirga aurantia]MTI20526.1 type II toxin-antitoxin system RelE/ParE family toxin [Fulvivirga aurantia]
MTIYWTKRSESKFLKIKSYINKEFGQLSTIKFQDKVFDFLELLEKFPELGSLEVAEKKIYGFQISKQTRVFYRINKNHISLLTFFDSRQDPIKKPK